MLREFLIIFSFIYLEPAIVHVDLYNPLQVAISLSDIILGCQYRKSTEVQDTTVDEDQVMPECKQSNSESSDMFDFNEFELQKISELTLEPMEKRTVKK